jgi:hypothetical protein
MTNAFGFIGRISSEIFDHIQSITIKQSSLGMLLLSFVRRRRSFALEAVAQLPSSTRSLDELCEAAGPSGRPPRPNAS